jgi:dTDP-4-dehydrorhamnose reductase
MARRILVTGGSGQLGIELLPRLAELGAVIAPERKVLDLTSDEATQQIIALQPTHVVHAAAATDVERCERQPAWAQAVNAAGTRRVAQASQALGAWLLYVSTDYVFDGAKTDPYVETDPPAPLNEYGRSKHDGEVQVQAVARRWAIVRTAWVYGHIGRNFVATILKRLQTGEQLSVVTDQIGSPTYAADLAEGITHLVGREATGTLHLTNGGSARVRPITSAELSLRARRPAYSVLAPTAWCALGFPLLRSWDMALRARLAAPDASPPPPHPLAD